MASNEAVAARDWLIWSTVHYAWWRVDRAGYTRDIISAGRYSEAEARLVGSSEENCAVPTPAAIESLAADRASVAAERDDLARKLGVAGELAVAARNASRQIQKLARDAGFRAGIEAAAAVAENPTPWVRARGHQPEDVAAAIRALGDKQ